MSSSFEVLNLVVVTSFGFSLQLHYPLIFTLGKLVGVEQIYLIFQRINLMN